MSTDAGADIEAEVRARNGGTSKGDVKAYASAGGAAGAAAGCAALGAPAAAPVCGQIGGYVAGAIAGALYDAFSSGEDEERAKQEARSGDWHRYQAAVVDYIDAQRATLLKAVNTFLAENWELVRNARVPCYTTPWGSPRFRDWFAMGAEAAPKPLTDADILTKIVPLLSACSPGFDAAWKDMAGAWGRVFAGSVSGSYGDNTEQARKAVREQNAALFERTGAEIKAGLAAGLQEWATSGAVYTISGGREADLARAAERQRVRDEYYAPKKPKRKKGSTGAVIAVAALGGALLLARK